MHEICHRFCKEKCWVWHVSDVDNGALYVLVLPRKTRIMNETQLEVNKNEQLKGKGRWFYETIVHQQFNNRRWKYWNRWWPTFTFLQNCPEGGHRWLFHHAIPERVNSSISNNFNSKKLQIQTCIEFAFFCKQITTVVFLRR